MKRIILIALILITLLTANSCSTKKEEIKEEDIRSICELATLKCYYNNVAKITKEGSFLQKDREMWIEYEGVATIGFDMTDIEITVSDDTVSITMPDAKLLGKKVVESTLNETSYISSSDGFFFKNKITAEDQRDAVKKGQKEMEKSIKNNKSLFVMAEIRAKELIESYIDSFGEAMGKEYKITWKKAE